MRFQLGIQITLLVVAIIIAFSVVKPKIDSISIDQNEIAGYKAAIENIGRYNKHLQTLVNQANALSSYDRSVLERYLPKEIDATLVASDISNIVSRNRLLLLDIIPGEVLPVTVYSADGQVIESSAYDPNTGALMSDDSFGGQDNSLMVQQFEVEVVGTYEQMKAMLSDLERNAYPLKIVKFEFQLEEVNASLVQYSLLLETYALPAN